MMGLHLALALLTATPEVGLLTRSTEGVTDETAAAVLRRLSEGLEKAGLTARLLKESCKDTRCLAALTVTQELRAVVSVTLIKGRRDLTLDVEAIDGKGEQLASGTFGVPFKGQPLPAECAEFFASLKAALAPPPQAVEDAPRVLQLAPAAEPRPEIVQTPRSRAPARAAAVTTISTGAVGLALLIASAVVKVQFDDTIGRRTSLQVAREQASLTNHLGTASIVALGIAGAAAVTTGVLWLREDSSETASVKE